MREGGTNRRLDRVGRQVHIHCDSGLASSLYLYVLISLSLDFNQILLITLREIH